MNESQSLHRSISRLGFWAALAVAVEVLVFAVSLWLPLSTRVDFIASFLLAPSFVALMVSLHYYAPPERKIWSHLGLAFAIMYAVMCTVSYFLQLAVVPQNSLQVSGDALKLIVFTPGSAIFAQDMLGYSFMCLATLAAAPVFAGGRLERWLKWLFVAHGLLFAPTLILTALFPSLAQGPGAGGADWIGRLALLSWCVVFIPLPVLLTVLFRRVGQPSAAF